MNSRTIAEASTKCKLPLSKGQLKAIEGCRADSLLAKWAEQHLGLETLLSAEELQIWNHLVDNDHRKKFEGEGPNLLPLHEDDLLVAIGELNQNTEHFTLQSEILKAQEVILKSQQQHTDRSNRDAKSFADDVERRIADEVQRLKLKISEVSEHLDSLFRNAIDHFEKTLKHAPFMITELLNTNDRVLEGLPRDSAMKHYECSADSVTVKITNQLIEKLATIATEELQTRLDRTFLMSLLKSSEEKSSVQQTEISSLQGLEADLKSLYSEIPDVVQISTLQSYGDPLTISITKELELRNRAIDMNSKEVERWLADMTAELEELVQRLDSFHSHRSVMNTMKIEVASLATAAIRGNQDQKVVSLQGHMNTQDKPAYNAIIRHFGISPRDSGSGRGVQATLEARITRLRQAPHLSATKIAPETISALNSRKETIKSLLGTVIGPVDNEQALSILDKRIEKLREGVETLGNADNSADTLKHKEFLETWNR